MFLRSVEKIDWAEKCGEVKSVMGAYTAGVTHNNKRQYEGQDLVEFKSGMQYKYWNQEWKCEAIYSFQVFLETRTFFNLP